MGLVFARGVYDSVPTKETHAHAGEEARSRGTINGFANENEQVADLRDYLAAERTLLLPRVDSHGGVLEWAFGFFVARFRCFLQEIHAAQQSFFFLSPPQLTIGLVSRFVSPALIAVGSG